MRGVGVGVGMAKSCYHSKRGRGAREEGAARAASRGESRAEGREGDTLRLVATMSHPAMIVPATPSHSIWRRCHDSVTTFTAATAVGR